MTTFGASRSSTSADQTERRTMPGDVEGTRLDRVVLSVMPIVSGAVSFMLLNVRDDPTPPQAVVRPNELLGWLGLFVAETLLFRVLFLMMRTREAGGAAR